MASLPLTANLIEPIAILQHRTADIRARISSFRLRGLNADASENAVRALEEARDGDVALTSSVASNVHCPGGGDRSRKEGIR